MQKKRTPAKRRVRKKPTVELPAKPTTKELLNLRRKISAQRPRFVRQESWRYKRVAKSWRKPKGVDSKMRLSVKGWPRAVSVGYGGPRSVKGLHPSGLRDILVHSVAELEKLNPATDAARIGANLGGRKRAQLSLRAKELSIRILNPLRLTPREP